MEFLGCPVDRALGCFGLEISVDRLFLPVHHPPDNCHALGRVIVQLSSTSRAIQF